MNIDKLQPKLREKKIDAALFMFNDPNVFYFSEFMAETAALIVPANKEPIVLLTKFDFERARKECRLKYFIFDDFIKEVKNRVDGKKIGINGSHITFAMMESLKKTFKRSELIDISQTCADIRKIKTDSEIKLLKEACKITDKIVDKTIKNIHKLKTELAVADYMNKLANEHGGTSFPTIVASDANASQPHHRPENIPLRKGFLVIDFGIRYKGYCTDITRTVYLGSPSKQEIEMYNKVLFVQEKAIKMLKPGVDCREPHLFADKQLGKFHFFHSIGHGLGVEVHEQPKINHQATEKLQPGMVITIEPGYYVAGKSGIRIEDDILLTKKGFEILTKFPKRLITLKHKA